MRRKKRIVKMTLIILFCVIFSSGANYFYFGIYEKNKIIENYEEKMAEYKFDRNTNCYILTKNVTKNNPLKMDNLKAVKIPKDLDSANLIKDSKKIKQSFYANDYKEGTILYKNMLYNYNHLASDLRLYEIASLNLPSAIEIGNYIDVRLNFPDGSDYVVLAKKKIRSIKINEKKKNETLCTLYLNAEEISRLALAKVDAHRDGNVKLYSTIYLDPQTQKASEITYPSQSMMTIDKRDNPEPLISSTENKAELEEMKVEEALSTEQIDEIDENTLSINEAVEEEEEEEEEEEQIKKIEE